MEDPFKSILEDETARTVLRQHLDALKPVDTPAPIRRADADKRRSKREKNSLKRMKSGDDADLQTPVLGHQSQQSQQFSTSALGVSLNVSNIKTVDRTYANLSALDSGESSINESIDLDLETAARFRKRKRSMKYLTQPEVSVSKISRKPSKAASDKKTPQISKKPSISSDVSTKKAHVGMNLSADKTYANLSSSVMESSSDSIDFGAVKNIRHPKKQDIVFPQIDLVISALKSGQGDDSVDLEAAKNLHQQPEKEGIVFLEDDPILSTPKSPHDDSINNFSLRSKSSSAPKWKSPQRFGVVQKDLARKKKTSLENQNTTVREDPVPQFDKTYENVVDGEDSLENIQVNTKGRFARKPAPLNLNLSALIKDLRGGNRSFGVLEESPTENPAASERQANENEIISESQATDKEMASDAIKDMGAENRSFGALEESQTENAAPPERQANENEIISESQATDKEMASDAIKDMGAENRSFGALEESQTENAAPPERQANENEIESESQAAEKEIASDTQSTPLTATEESMADDKTTPVGQVLPVGEKENIHGRPLAKVEVDVLSVVDRARDRSKFELNDTIPPPANFRDVNEVDDERSQKSPSSSSVANIKKTLSTSFSSDSGGDDELGGHISAALSSLDSDRESIALGSPEGSDHIHSSPRSIEKNAASPSLRESPLSTGKGTPLSLRRSSRKSVEKDYRATPERKNFRENIGEKRISLPLIPRKNVDGQNTSLPPRMSLGKYAGVETTYSPLRMSPRQKVEREISSSLEKSSGKLSKDNTSGISSRKIDGREVTSTLRINPQINVDNHSVSPLPRVEEEPHVSQHSPSAPGKTKMPIEREQSHETDIGPLNSMTAESSSIPFQDKSGSRVEDHVVISSKAEYMSSVDLQDKGVSSPVKNIPKKNPGLTKLVLTQEEVEVHPEEFVRAMQRASRNLHSNLNVVEMDPSVDTVSSEKSLGIDHQQIVGMQEKSAVDQSEDVIAGAALATVDDEIPANITRAKTFDKDPVSEDLYGVHVAEKDPESDNEDLSLALEGSARDNEAVHTHEDPANESEDVAYRTQENPASGEDVHIAGEDPVNEGEDVSYQTQKDSVIGVSVARVAQEDTASDDDELNLLSVNVKKAPQSLENKSAEDGISAETTAYRVSFGDEASGGDSSSVETPCIVRPLEDQSGENNSAKISAKNDSAQKIESQPGPSKTKQMTMRDFLQKLASKPVQPPGIGVKGKPRPWLGDLLRDKGTGLSRKSPWQASSAKKPKQKTGKKPLPSCLPKAVTREIFSHYAKCKVAPNGMNEIMKISETYWKNLSTDLVNFMNARRGSSDIRVKDMKTIMSRQGLISSDLSYFALIEEYLPVEDWNVLIPTAFAKDNIYPSEPAG